MKTPILRLKFFREIDNQSKQPALIPLIGRLFNFLISQSCNIFIKKLLSSFMNDYSDIAFHSYYISSDYMVS